MAGVALLETPGEMAPRSAEELAEFMQLSAFVSKTFVVSTLDDTQLKERDEIVKMIAGRLEQKVYGAGQVVLRKGDIADLMCFIYDGSAEVFLENPPAELEGASPRAGAAAEERLRSRAKEQKKLKQQLSMMKPRVLVKRAEKMGIDEAKLEVADDHGDQKDRKAALVDLIVKHQAVARSSTRSSV